MLLNKMLLLSAQFSVEGDQLDTNRVSWCLRGSCISAADLLHPTPHEPGIPSPYLCLQAMFACCYHLDMGLVDRAQAFITASYDPFLEGRCYACPATPIEADSARPTTRYLPTQSINIASRQTALHMCRANTTHGEPLLPQADAVEILLSQDDVYNMSESELEKLSCWLLEGGLTKWPLPVYDLPAARRAPPASSTASRAASGECKRAPHPWQTAWPNPLHSHWPS